MPNIYRSTHSLAKKTKTQRKNAELKAKSNFVWFGTTEQKK